jgi:hypothetical protein
MVSGTTSSYSNKYIYVYSDSVVEMYDNFSHRKLPVTGSSILNDRLDFKMGCGTHKVIKHGRSYDLNLTKT